MKRMKRAIVISRLGAELLRLLALLSGLGCYVLLEGVGQGIYPLFLGLISAMLAALLCVALAHVSCIFDEWECEARQELERRRSLSGLEPRDWRRVG